MKWEYKEEALEPEEMVGEWLEEYLDTHGDDGWELCVMMQIGFHMQFVWKRQAKE